MDGRITNRLWLLSASFLRRVLLWKVGKVYLDGASSIAFARAITPMIWGWVRLDIIICKTCIRGWTPNKTDVNCFRTDYWDSLYSLIFPIFDIIVLRLEYMARLDAIDDIFFALLMWDIFLHLAIMILSINSHCVFPQAWRLGWLLGIRVCLIAQSRDLVNLWIGCDHGRVLLDDTVWVILHGKVNYSTIKSATLLSK